MNKNKQPIDYSPPGEGLKHGSPLMDKVVDYAPAKDSSADPMEGESVAPETPQDSAREGSEEVSDDGGDLD